MGQVGLSVYQKAISGTPGATNLLAKGGALRSNRIIDSFNNLNTLADGGWVINGPVELNNSVAISTDPYLDKTKHLKYTGSGAIGYSHVGYTYRAILKTGAGSPIWVPGRDIWATFRTVSDTNLDQRRFRLGWGASADYLNGYFIELAIANNGYVVYFWVKINDTNYQYTTIDRRGVAGVPDLRGVPVSIQVATNANNNHRVRIWRNAPNGPAADLLEDFTETHADFASGYYVLYGRPMFLAAPRKGTISVAWDMRMDLLTEMLPGVI